MGNGGGGGGGPWNAEAAESGFIAFINRSSWRRKRRRRRETLLNPAWVAYENYTAERGGGRGSSEKRVLQRNNTSSSCSLAARETQRPLPPHIWRRRKVPLGFLLLLDVHTPPPSFTPPMIAATLFLLPPWPSISAFEKRALLLFSYLRPLVGKGGEERRRRVFLSTFFEETFSRRPPLPSLFGREETL